VPLEPAGDVDSRTRTQDLRKSPTPVDASPKFVTADGGIIDGDPGDILEEDTDECDSDPWSAPRPEIGEHGHTGAFVVECRDCEVEALEGRTQHAIHFDGCSHE
jgi:hypothetical protein